MYFSSTSNWNLVNFFYDTRENLPSWSEVVYAKTYENLNRARLKRILRENPLKPFISSLKTASLPLKKQITILYFANIAFEFLVRPYMREIKSSLISSASGRKFKFVAFKLKKKKITSASSKKHFEMAKIF